MEQFQKNLETIKNRVESDKLKHIYSNNDLYFDNIIGNQYFFYLLFKIVISIEGKVNSMDLLLGRLFSYKVKGI